MDSWERDICRSAGVLTTLYEAFLNSPYKTEMLKYRKESAEFLTEETVQVAIHDTKPLIKAFFLAQRKGTNYIYEMVQAAASALFLLMDYLEAVFPWHTHKASHCTSPACTAVGSSHV